jgi:hypothetical protein
MVIISNANKACIVLFRAANSCNCRQKMSKATTEGGGTSIEGLGNEDAGHQAWEVTLLTDQKAFLLCRISHKNQMHLPRGPKVLQVSYMEVTI